MHLKKLITNLTRTDVSPLILRLKGEKHAFTFEDIEKESGIKLTSADKFLIRSVAEKKFKMQVVCEVPENQLKFFPKAKELS